MRNKWVLIIQESVLTSSVFWLTLGGRWCRTLREGVLTQGEKREEKREESERYCGLSRSISKYRSSCLVQVLRG